MGIRVVEVFFGFSAKGCDSSVEVRRLVARLALFDASTLTVARCSAERKTREGQGQNLHSDTDGSMRNLATKRQTGNRRGFVKHWAEDEMISVQSEEVAH